MMKNRTIKISNDLKLIPKVIDEILESIKSRCRSNDVQAISIGLYEVIANAMEHGNLGIDWETKNKALETQRLDELIEERMKKEPFASRNVTIECLVDCDKATFIIGDEGDGFDRNSVPDPTEDENLSNPHGRGLFIISACMDKVSFNEKGNKVTLTKYFTDTDAVS